MNKQAKIEKPVAGHQALLSAQDFARLGDGEVAYIKQLTEAEAGRLFPALTGLPKGIPLFALHAADGRPLALADSRQAALGHAREDELDVALVH